MARRSNETPAQKADRLTRRVKFLEDSQIARNPLSTPAARMKAEADMDEYYAWVNNVLMTPDGKIK